MDSRWKTGWSDALESLCEDWGIAPAHRCGLPSGAPARARRAFTFVALPSLAGCASRSFTDGDRLGDAAARGNLVHVKALQAKGAPLESRDPCMGGTSLIRAARPRATPGMVAALPGAGADINAADTAQGVTARRAAIRLRQPEVVKLLLRRGADANAQHQRGGTALSIAVGDGQADMVTLLLDHGAKSDTVISLGWTPFGFAAGPGHFAMVEAMLARDADVSGRRPNGGTALMIAAGDGHADVAQALLGRGAGEKLVASWGSTALTLATRLGHDSVVRARLRRARDRTAYAAIDGAWGRAEIIAIRCFPRTRKPSRIKELVTHRRGQDELISVSLGDPPAAVRPEAGRRDATRPTAATMEKPACSMAGMHPCGAMARTVTHQRLHPFPGSSRRGTIYAHNGLIRLMAASGTCVASALGRNRWITIGSTS